MESDTVYSDTKLDMLIICFCHEEFTQCPPGYLKCPRSFCIPPRFICDGQKHCQYGVDELMCGKERCIHEYMYMMTHMNGVLFGFLF